VKAAVKAVAAVREEGKWGDIIKILE